MKCPYCTHSDSKVVDSRSGEGNKSIRRRRECLACHKRFSTFESLESLPLMVIKSNETREPFSSHKLRESLMKACEKRPVSIDKIEKIVAEVEYSISNYVMEVSTRIIGDMVLEKLQQLDPVSYLRYASVYKGFNSAEDFIIEANVLHEKIRQAAQESAPKKREKTRGENESRDKREHEAHNVGEQSDNV